VASWPPFGDEDAYTSLLSFFQPASWDLSDSALPGDREADLLAVFQSDASASAENPPGPDMPDLTRLPDETSKAYDAFMLYATMGPQRSLAKVAEKYGKSTAKVRHMYGNYSDGLLSITGKIGSKPMIVL
jgi:hypothetical protein